ncbi:MAG: CRISPR system precrRNA processing endoribonuclease RAMP protein Cas6 [Bacillota bacterium]
MGQVLKEMVCIRRDRQCRRCSISNKCSYTFVFETATYYAGQPRDSGGVPQPFVLEPPLEEETRYEVGQTINFSLVLMGRGVDYLPYFLSAFDFMGERGIGRRRGRFELFRVTDSYSGEVVYDRESGEVNSLLTPRNLSDLLLKSEACQSCCLTLLTPLRLKQGGSLTEQFNFELLIRAILRRITYLNQYFGDQEIELDYKQLIDQAKEIKTRARNIAWRDWERYSSRQDTRMKLGGIVGDIEFAGEITPFWPFLLMGQEIHIGKNTTFGLGKYLVERSG